MTKTGIIYIATDTKRNMQYVGQTTKTLERRLKGKYNQHFQRILDKRPDTIKWEIIGEYPVGELDNIEKLYIDKMNTVYPNGYNFETGGNRLKEMSSTSKKRCQ